MSSNNHFISWKTNVILVLFLFIPYKRHLYCIWLGFLSGDNLYYHFDRSGFLTLVVTVFTGVWWTSSLFRFSRPLSRTIADFICSVVGIVSILPLISTSPNSGFLETVPQAPTMEAIIINFMFDKFFSSLARSRYFPVFHLQSLLLNQNGKWKVLWFLLMKTRIGRLAWIEWCVYISKSSRILCILFSRIDSDLCK